MTAFSVSALAQLQCRADFSPHEHLACEALGIGSVLHQRLEEASAIPDAALAALATAGNRGGHVCDVWLEVGRIVWSGRG